MITYRFTSQTFLGQTVKVQYSKYSSNTRLDLGSGTFPFEYTTDQLAGTFYFYIPIVDRTFPKVIDIPPIDIYTNQISVPNCDLTGVTTYVPSCDIDYGLVEIPVCDIDYEINDITPTPTPTYTSTPTPTPTPTKNSIPQATPTQTPTVTPTLTRCTEYVISANLPAEALSLINRFDSTYSSLGTRIYSTFILNGTGVYETFMTQGVWTNEGPSLSGPLNRTALWMSSQNYPFGCATCMIWLGFSACINVVTPKTYWVGLGADNNFRFVVDGVEFVNTLGGPYSDTSPGYAFKNWHVYPIQLTAGEHIVELFGLNVFLVAGFGCEIYDNTLEELTGATTINDLNIIFSSRDYQYITISQNLEGYYTNFGYSCPDGYLYQSCDNTCIGCSIYPPTQTATSSPTPTPTITPTITKTPTITPSITPTRAVVNTIFIKFDSKPFS